MSPDERELISGLMSRLRGFGAVEKDHEAESLINSEVRQVPDSAYLLVQTVLVQEQTLSAANDRIKQLETRVRELEATGGRAATTGGGGFLGGLFGGGAARPAATSVPITRPSMAPGGSPWGQSAQPQQGYQQPQYQQPQYQQPMQAPGRSGGGFMAQALTTAAGVAGGMMAADALRGMLGGGHHGSGFGQHDTATDDAAMNASQDAAQDQDLAQDAAQDQELAQDNNDPGTSSASDDSGGGWDSGSDSTDA